MDKIEREFAECLLNELAAYVEVAIPGAPDECLIESWHMKEDRTELYLRLKNGQFWSVSVKRVERRV